MVASGMEPKPKQDNFGQLRGLVMVMDFVGKSKRILEIGSSIGDFTQKLASFNDSVIIYSLDISPEMVKIAQERFTDR